jgi:hypothetical protein
MKNDDQTYRKRYKSPLPISRHIGDFLQGFVPEKQKILNRIRECWGIVAGEQIAAHAYPDDIDFKTLLINVDDPIWINELTLLRGEIFAGLHNRIPSLKMHADKIRFRNGKVVKPEKQKPVRKKAIPAPPPEIINEIDENLKVIEDPELKKALRRFFINTYETKETEE